GSPARRSRRGSTCSSSTSRASSRAPGSREPRSRAWRTDRKPTGATQMNSPHQCLRAARATIVLSVVLLGACGHGLVRDPLPEALVGQAHPLGIPGLRAWGDAPDGAELSRMLAERSAYLKATYGPAVAAGEPPELHYLGISGGGQWGAFGAGSLQARSESGSRPEFTGVSGVATGAIIAPSA